MIGVDIVDTNESFIQGKYGLDDYKKRIMGPLDQPSCSSFEALDRIWVIKEACYKCYSNATGVEFMNPRRIVISNLHQDHTFEAIVDDRKLRGEYFQDQGYCYAVAQFADNATGYTLFFGEDPLPQPYLYHGRKDYPVAILHAGEWKGYSRSHHGRYTLSVISGGPYN